MATHRPCERRRQVVEPFFQHFPLCGELSFVSLPVLHVCGLAQRRHGRLFALLAVRISSRDPVIYRLRGPDALHADDQQGWQEQSLNWRAW